MDFQAFFRRLFNRDVSQELEDIDIFSFTDELFINKNLTYNEVINFIKQYKNEIITSSLKDNMLIDVLLEEKMVIDKTKKSTINKEYLEQLTNDILNGNFNQKSITF